VFQWRIWAILGFGARVALVTAIALGGGLFFFEQWNEYQRTAERHALEGRALDLLARAAAPGSPLGCLDALAGETVEAACEKAVFASPEATAAAVSYVAAQLALLAAGQDLTAELAQSAVFAQLRRAVEHDRFGIAAHILAARDGCTAEQCAAFAVLTDASRIGANITAQTFAARVKQHAAAWPAEGASAPAAPPPVAGLAPQPPAGAAARHPNGLFFPSATSIPPVSIMTAEPGAADNTTGAAESKPVRKPLPPPRPSVNPNAGAAAPLPLSPQ
jgi:hypothetical protein